MPDLLTDGVVAGLPQLHRGKVRNSYRLSQPGQIRRFPVVSDRISIFDFVLSAHVRDKGAILNAINIFWRLRLPEFRHDLQAFGEAIDESLPLHKRRNPELQARATVVEERKPLRLEGITRGYLTGTGLEAYRKTGRVCGHVLPPGLQDGDELPKPIFTPTTKAEVGHDEHMDVHSVRGMYGMGPENLFLGLYGAGQGYALQRGLIVADTKGECDENLVLLDEILTPDSSRYWDLEEWQVSRRADVLRAPSAYDKQFVREWGKSLGIHLRDPENHADVAWVQSLVVPTEILEETSRRYHVLFMRLTGMSLPDFQRTVMGIR